ncbi:MAG: M14 family metallopeptidase, partial [Anaerolineales bacterium]
MKFSKRTSIQLISASILLLAVILIAFLWPSKQAQALLEGDEASLSGVSWSRGEFQAAQILQSPEEVDEYDFWVVRAYFSDRQMVDAVASWLEPWDVDYREGFIVLGVTPEQYNLLIGMGFRLEIDLEMTAQINQPRQALPGQTTGIPGYPCYRTVEETFATAEGIVADYPELATWIDIGDSWEKVEPGGEPGYDMMVLRLTNSAVAGPKPKLFAMTSIHAREYTPAELNTRFAEYLVGNYGVDPDVTWLLDYHEIHLLLLSNPDGRKWAEQGYLWRKNTNNNYCADTTSRGVDLNRNFEFQWGCCGGSSGSECNETFRAESPASEPETQAVQNYLRSVFPDQREDPLDAPSPADATGVFLDLHSFGELVLWPWGFTDSQAPNGNALQSLGRKLAYDNGYSPAQAIDLYPTDGTTDDFAYGDLGLASYAYELGTSFFQDCNTFENTILPDNLSSLIYAARVSRTPYLTPAGPDALNLALSTAFVEAGEPVTLTAQINDTRFNNSNGLEPTQNITA